MTKILLCGDFKTSDISRFHPTDEICKMIKEAEISVLNFEVPISGFGEGVFKSGPSLKQDPKAPDFLKKMGFDVVLLANNHMMDFGKEGCEATIKAFEGILTVGAGSSEEAYSVKIIEKNEVKIGFLALCQYEFGVVESKEEGYGVAWVLSLDVEETIRQAREKVDYLIVCPHAGVEHTKAPLPEWRHLYKKYIDWGADAVVASHPHRPQGYEYYKGKPILYSLGNFFWDGVFDYDGWTEGIAVEINLGEDFDIKIHTMEFNSNGDLTTTPNSDYIKLYNELLGDEKKYMDYINNLACVHWRGLMYGLLRGSSGVSLMLGIKLSLRLLIHMILGHSDSLYALNIIRNESHRWLLQRSLMVK